MANSSLSFPSFDSVDTKVRCPIFTELVNTELDASRLSVDQLDPLKEELEVLCNSLDVRITNIVKEIDVLAEWSEVNKRNERAQSEEPSDSSAKSSERPYVRCLRDTPCRSENNSPAPSRAKNRQARTQTLGVDSLGRLPKSDAPEKFWAIVEPYCADITNEDMKTLEELMSSHDDDLDYYKTPSLGKHYSQRWAQEDLELEKKDGVKLLEKRKTLAGQKRRLDSAGETSSSSTEEHSVKTPTSDDGSNEECPFGPLTQRLVSALIDENLIGSASSAYGSMQEMDVDDANGLLTSDQSGGEITPQSLAKELSITNSEQLEKRLRRELEQQGFLQSEDSLDNEDGDEILAELKQKQQELKSVVQYNVSMTKRLHRLAKEEMNRQDMRRRLAAVDADVMEAYKKIQQARQKKRAPTKREKDFVMKALKERESLVKQIETYTA